MTIDKSKLGLVQVFWGDGKGKTTSSLGTALRACGNGFRVHLVQFMKNGADSLEKQISGEIDALNNLENFSFKRFGMDGWVMKKPTQNQINSCVKALEHVKKSLENPEIDIVIADEILYAIELGTLNKEDILNLIREKPEKKELILTGSHTPYPEIFEMADLVTEMKKIKHPYDKGILARKGIEY